MLSTSAIRNANDVNWKRISIWKKRRGGFTYTYNKMVCSRHNKLRAGSNVLTLYSLFYYSYAIGKTGQYKYINVMTKCI